jgi:hypothetical protein
VDINTIKNPLNLTFSAAVDIKLTKTTFNRSKANERTVIEILDKLQLIIISE